MLAWRELFQWRWILVSTDGCGFLLVHFFLVISMKRTLKGHHSICLLSLWQVLEEKVLESSYKSVRLDSTETFINC